MAVYRPDIPPHIAEIAPLLGDLAGLWRIKVKRFRIVYELDRRARVIRIFAIGHRREVYEEIADRLRQGRERK